MFQSVKEFLEAARNARMKANDWKVKEKPNSRDRNHGSAAGTGGRTDS